MTEGDRLAAELGRRVNCCADGRWRGRLCAYHQGFADAWDERQFEFDRLRMQASEDIKMIDNDLTTQDLTTQLRGVQHYASIPMDDGPTVADLCHEAADRIDELEAEVERLRATALRRLGND